MQQDVVYFILKKNLSLKSAYFSHRLVLATALALKPRVMFIDEITRYVDIYQSGDNSLLKVIYSPFEMFATISGVRKTFGIFLSFSYVLLF